VGLIAPGPLAGAAGQVGAKYGQVLDNFQAMKLVADSYEKAGGIGGRPLRTVEVEVDVSGDYTQQENAACQTFTQDNHVDVVMSVTGANDEALSQCLTRARIPLIATGRAADGVSSQGRYPYVRWVTSANMDRALLTVVNRSAAAHALTSQSRVGVVVEDCPADQEVYERTVLPALKRAGVAAVTTSSTDCVSSFGSLGTSGSRMSSAVLSFASAHVDTVLFVSKFEGTLLLFFSKTAEQQQYRPRYLLSSNATVAGNQSNLDTKQMANMSGWGWIPTMDTTNAHTAVTTAQRDCMKRFAAEGAQPTGWSNIDYAAAYWACDGFSALEGALTGSGGDSRLNTFLPALDSASSTLQLASIVDGRIRLNDNRHDGASSVRAFSYQSSCSCFAYSGPPQDTS
jgi:ABC-type branched-subunit amino acid transport system substrate-binding protein